MLLLLDRDGVVNEDRPHGVASIAEFTLLPGVTDALAKATQAGYRVAIVTNQALVADGRLTPEGLATIHQHMMDEVSKAGGRIDRIYSCTDPRDRPSARRKPAPGMLLEALRDFRAEAAKTTMIGDDLRDLEAAYAAGCNRALVRTGKGASIEQSGLPQKLQPVKIYDTLLSAVEDIISAS